MKRFLVVTIIYLILGSLVLVILASQITLSALPEPNRLETNLMTRAKHVLIRRSARQGLPPAPAANQRSLTEGEKLYGVECAACHGLNGCTPTDAGRWMYPRSADLGSTEVQDYSDGELFWIIKNGIRLSGMPAFGKVETDQNIWSLVRYVRSFPRSRS